MREIGDDNKYTKEAVDLQNSLARDVFVNVVKGMDKQQQDKLRKNNPKADCSYNYTRGEALISINSSYRQEIFGDRKDFDNSIQSIIASNRITSLRDRMNSSGTKVPYKSTQNLSKVDFTTLKMYQEKKQKS